MNYSKKDLLEIVSNHESLKSEIIKSKGFVLYLLDKHNIEVSKETLISAINEYSIRYIVEKNMSILNEEEKNIVLSYLKDDKNNSEEIIWDLSTLVSRLKNKESVRSLPKNFQISFEDFLNNQKELSKLLYERKTFSGRDNFNGNHFLLDNIFKKLTKEDFLKIDKDVLINNPSLFNIAPQLMSDKDIKELFDLSVNNYFSKDYVKNNGYKETLTEYSSYVFEDNEKEKFIQLIKNDYSRDFETIANHNSFNKFFTKKDYILSFELNNLKHFTKKELDDYSQEIKDFIYERFNNWSGFGDLIELKIDQNSFEKIIDKEFIKKLLLKNNKFKFESVDRDNSNKKLFANYINETVCQLCVEDFQFTSLVGFNNILNHVNYKLEYEQHSLTEEFIANIDKIFSNVEKNFTTEEFLKNNNTGWKAYSNYDLSFLFLENMKNKTPTINYLFALIKIEEDAKNWKKEVFAEEIKRIIPILNKEEVLGITKILKYKINEGILVDGNPPSSFENSFLNFQPEDIKNMNFDTFVSIFEISGKFREMVLKEKLDYIIIDDAQKNPNSYSNLIVKLLNTVKDKDSKYFSFLKKFTSRNEEYMLKNHLSDLIIHPLRTSLVDIDTKQIEIDSFDKFFNFAHKLKEITEKIKLNKKNNEENTSLESIYKNTEKEIREIYKDISFDFFSKKLIDSDVVTSITLYRAMPNRSEYHDLMMEKIKGLDFDVVMGLRSNPIFLDFIYDNKKQDYDNKRSYIVFNQDFSEEQNISIVESFLKTMKDYFGSNRNNKINLSKILSFFSEEPKYKISNNLVIKHEPENMFNSYDYIPINKESYYLAKHVKADYSLEQIKNAIDNLNKEGKKIICQENDNLTHQNLFAHIFSEKEKKEERLNQYLMLLKYLEEDPINYIALLHSDNINNFLDESFSKKDIAKSYFYNQHVNIDVLLQGMRDIFTLAKEKNNVDNHEEVYKGVAVKNALKAVSNFIAFTYYSNQENFESEFNEEKSRKILKLLIEEVPMIVFSTPYIGNIGSTSKEISSNFDYYYNEYLIDKLFLDRNIRSITDEHFSLSYEKRKEYWQSENADIFLNSMIKYFTQKKDINSLYKLEFIIKEHKFNEERPYSKQNKDFNGDLIEFISNDEYSIAIQKSIEYLELSHKLKEDPKKTTRAKKI